MNSLTCAIVDDEKAGRERMSRLLRMIDGVTMVSCEADPVVAVRKIILLKPSVVFLDIEMPGMSGFELIRELEAQQVRPHIIFVTAFNQYAIRAIRAAAFDFLLKPCDLEELKTCLDRLQATSRPLHPLLQKLTAREKEILGLADQGMTSAEIGEHLFISKSTVDSHRKSMLEKTGFKNLTALLKVVFQRQG
jgi:two-component system LytT family response regulator